MEREIEIKKLKQNMRNYLYNIYAHQDCCETETYNAVQDYYKLIMLTNGINYEEYSMTLHLVSSLSDEIYALMDQEEHDETRFNVYLRKDNFRVHNSAETSIAFFNLIDAGHEFHHIVQYIQEPDIVNDYDDRYSEIESSMLMIANQCKGEPKQFKHIDKIFDRYELEIMLISTMEKQADLKSYRFLINLLNEIVQNDEDINFANFLYNCKFYITDDFKQRKRLLYESHKAHGITAEMLKKRFGIDESLIKLP